MPEIKRNKSEHFEPFFRRFVTTIRRSGKLVRSKQTKFLHKKENESKRKKDALYRLKAKKAIDYLKKIGKFDEDNIYKKR